MLSHGRREVQIKSFFDHFLLARSACLLAAQKEEDMTMYAIEKDEAYLPEFKECVKEKIVEAQSIYPENHVKHFNF